MAQERLPPGGAGGQAAVDCHNEWRSANSADRIGAQAPPLRDYQTDIEARGDGRGPGEDLFPDLVKDRTYAWLIEGGYLVPPIVFAAVNPDLRDVPPLDTGDYSPSELEERMNTSALVGEILEHWFRLGKNRRTILFTAVRHSARLRNEFRRAGVAAEHLDAKTSLDERKRAIAGLKACLMARGHWFEFARATRAEPLALPRLLNRRRCGRHTQGAKHAAHDLRRDDTSILRIAESRAGVETFPMPPTLGVPNRTQRRRWDIRKIESPSPLDVLGRCFLEMRAYRTHPSWSPNDYLAQST